MKFLANENFPKTAVDILKEKGFDIKSIGGELAGITDNDVMKLAMEEQRTIITYDSDYGELIFKYGQRPEGGVIYLRTLPQSPDEAVNMVEKLSQLEHVIFKRTLTVVDNHGIRQKKY